MKNGKSWARLGLEGVLIVSSILLAFGIEAWWDGRQERARIETALRNLEAGFTEHLELIDAELRRMEPFEGRVEVYLGGPSAADRELEVGGYGLILEAIHRPIIGPLNTDELLALLEAPALNDLDAAEMWAASAAWRGQWRIILDRHDSLYELEDEALRAIAGLDGARSMVGRRGAREEISATVLQTARSDANLLSLAAVKAYHLRILRVLYGGLQTGASNVLVQIRSELAQ